MTSINASVDVALDPAEAFRVFAEEIDAWYVVDRATVLDVTRTAEIRLEPYVGGRLLDVYDLATGEGRTLATVTAWEPGRGLAFVDARDTEVEVTFEAVPYGTRVTIEHRGLERVPAAERDHVRRFGWPLILPWYEQHVRASHTDDRRSGE